MSETHVIHTLPAETTVSEDLQSVYVDYKRFYHRNRDVLIVVGAIGVALLINRAILRRELRRLNFTAEFFPYEPTDYLDEEMLDAMAMAE